MYLRDGWTSEFLQAVENPDDPFAGQAGYKALGSLLHHGDYSEEFLVPVGDQLIARDRADPLDGRTSELQESFTSQNDPFIGLFDALERNPEAATTFFDPQRAGAEGHLQYLLADREWPEYAEPPGPGRSGEPENLPAIGQDALGAALEAATLEGEPGARGAAIVSETVNVLGSGDDPYGEIVPPPLRDSVGRMIGGHIGTVQDTILTGADTDVRGHWADPVSGEPRFDKSELLRVMGDATIDPNAYAAMYDANTVATAGDLERIATDPALSTAEKQTLIVDQARESANVFGALDQAKQFAIEQHYDDVDARYNDLIKAAARSRPPVSGRWAPWVDPAERCSAGRARPG